LEDKFLKELSIKRILSKRGVPPDILNEISEAIDQRIKAITEAKPDRMHQNIASLIDHTLLVPHSSTNDIRQLCDQAKQYHFYSVCVNPSHIPLCKRLLAQTDIKICTVIGFPLGSNTTATKVFEAHDAESMGADEMDMVMNIGALKDRHYELVKEDIANVVNATSNGIVTKVILENAYLTIEEKIVSCLLAEEAGADFVKTSTGFAPSGATLEDVALMRLVAGEKMGVKAAGGIRDYRTGVKMLMAGATRIGASSSVKIVSGSY